MVLKVKVNFLLIMKLAFCNLCCCEYVVEKLLLEENFSLI